MKARVLTFVTALVLLGGIAGFMVVRSAAAAGEVPVLAQTDGYDNQPTLGRDSAPVKVILFENFMCEYCKAFEEEAFPRLKREYIDTGKVQAYYVNLAWGEEDAVNAGLAGECAFKQDEEAFWDYKTAIFQAQGDHDERWATVDNLVRIARTGVPALNAKELRTCIKEKHYQSEVQRDLELGDYVGVQGTPSIVVNDEGFQNPSFAALQAAIDSRLADN